jgi:cobalamin biosynthesis Mg chelatase CobN
MTGGHDHPMGGCHGLAAHGHPRPTAQASTPSTEVSTLCRTVSPRKRKGGSPMGIESIVTVVVIVLVVLFVLGYFGRGRIRG